MNDYPEIARDDPNKDREEETGNSQESLTLNEISTFTGISLAQLISLPHDIKDDVLIAYRGCKASATADELTATINAILEGNTVIPSDYRSDIRAAEAKPSVLDFLDGYKSSPPTEQTTEIER